MVDDAAILSRLRAGLAELYGDRIERVVLFGSRARGDAREDSDYDVALFLNDLSNRWDELKKIVPIELAILEDTGAFIQTMPFTAGAWRNQSSPLMREIRREGRDL